MTVNIWESTNVGLYIQNDGSELRVIHPELLRMLGNIKGKDIADYGCGEGKLLKELIKKGASVFGYDISEEMIKRAKKRINNKGSLKVICSGQIPLLDNSLDAVVSNLVLMMCPSLEDIEKIFLEVSRVLKPGGSWVYCITHPSFLDKDFTTCRNIFFKRRDYFDEGKTYQFVLKNKDGTEITDRSFVDYNYTLSSYLNMLLRTGFDFKELKEIQLPEDDFPPYMIVRGDKK